MKREHLKVICPDFNYSFNIHYRTLFGKWFLVFICMLDKPQTSKTYQSRGQVLKNQKLTISFATLSVLSHDISFILWPLFLRYFSFHVSKDLDLFLGCFLPTGKVYPSYCLFQQRASGNLSRERSSRHYLLSDIGVLIWKFRN